MTLNKTINITKGNIQHKEIIYKPLKINFQNLNKQTITIEYSCSINLQNKNIIEINFINNNTNKYINTPKYKMKKLFI